MVVAATQFSLSKKAYEIYVAGCTPPHCEGCHNQKLWAFNMQDGVTPTEIILDFKRKLHKFPELIQNIFIMGGEPLDQDKAEMFTLLRELHKFGIPIWLFTRYDIVDIPIKFLPFITYIKTGKYDENLPPVISHGIELASSNQRIWKKGVDFQE